MSKDPFRHREKPNLVRTIRPKFHLPAEKCNRKDPDPDTHQVDIHIKDKGGKN